MLGGTIAGTSWFSARPGCSRRISLRSTQHLLMCSTGMQLFLNHPAREMPDGVSRCRLAPMRDLVFTTPTGKGR